VTGFTAVGYGAFFDFQNCVCFYTSDLFTEGYAGMRLVF
jgi:hypothetical protein